MILCLKKSPSDAYRIARQFSTKRRRKGKLKKASSSSKSNSIISRLSQNASSNLKTPKALVPISKAITSPKVQKEAFGRFLEFQKKVQSAILPDFWKNRSLSITEREKATLVMDGRWWMWNLALAAVPALTVHVICQYYQSEMEEFYRHQRILEAKKNGLDISEEDMEFVNSSSTGVKENGNLWDIKETSFWGAVTDILRLQSDGVVKEQADESTNIIHTSNEDNEDFDRENDNIATSDGQTIQNSSQEELTIESMMERIELLEKKLEARNQNPNRKSSSRQSNIRSRRMVAQELENQVDESPDSNKIKTQEIRFNMDVYKEGMSRFAKQKYDEILHRGNELKQSILGTLDDEPKPNIDEQENDDILVKIQSDDYPAPILNDEKLKANPLEAQIADTVNEAETLRSEKENPTKNKWLKRIPFFKAKLEDSIHTNGKED